MSVADAAAPDRSTVRRLVQAALDEDGASQDLTTNALVPPDQAGPAVLTAKPVASAAGESCDLSVHKRTGSKRTLVLAGACKLDLYCGCKTCAGGVARARSRYSGVARKSRKKFNENIWNIRVLLIPVVPRGLV